ncbi:hypothetical protein [Wolbachia pipientis]|uniref:hypothetical protein n=1 Tax=Wolbachia pipientis TaxID=955 RepID=UPI0025A4A926|nr:hypothetical protein [Wolbachia pipientis]MDM8335253.1 hypothetical protein [Wolbachia pipientis]
MTKELSIWKWKNTVPITKIGIESTAAIASLAAATTTILVATNVIAVPVFLMSVANPVGIAALFVAAVYFTALAYSSCQQMHAVEGAQGKDSKNDRNVSFSELVDVVRGINIVEENGALLLKFSSDDDRAVLLGEKNDQPIFVTFKDKDGKYLSKGLKYKVEDNNVIVISINEKEVKNLAEVKGVLGVGGKANLPSIAVSNKTLKALKDGVSANLQEVAVNAAIFEALGK